MDRHTPESLMTALMLGAVVRETPDSPIRSRRYFLGDVDVTRAFNAILLEQVPILWDAQKKVWYHAAARYGR